MFLILFLFFNSIFQIVKLEFPFLLLQNKKNNETQQKHHRTNAFGREQFLQLARMTA
jgi:hypothetical protein